MIGQKKNIKLCLLFFRNLTIHKIWEFTISKLLPHFLNEKLLAYDRQLRTDLYSGLQCQYCEKKSDTDTEKKFCPNYYIPFSFKMSLNITRKLYFIVGLSCLNDLTVTIWSSNYIQLYNDYPTVKLNIITAWINT